MKSLILIGITLMSSFLGLAQTKFSSGHFVDNSGQKIDCLIKNEGWQNNPTKFVYKISEGKAAQTANLSDFKSFKVNGFEYHRFTVSMDHSSDLVGQLDNSKHPNFVEETVLLRKLVDGPAKLYMFVNNNLTRFFYEVDQGDLQALVYKRYLKVMPSANGNQVIGINNTYRSQLSTDIKCKTMSIGDLQKTFYKEKDLKRYFETYNLCVDPTFQVSGDTEAKTLFHFYLKVGAKISSFSFNNLELSNIESDVGSQVGYKVGAELEVVFPFNNHKWALFMQPTYQSWEVEDAEATFRFLATGMQGTEGLSVTNTSLEIPICIRHYMFLNDNSRIFISAGYVINNVLDGTVDFDMFDDIDLSASFNGFVELGFILKNRFNLAGQYHFNRNLLRSQLGWRSEFNSIDVVIGYNILAK